MYVTVANCKGMDGATHVISGVLVVYLLNFARYVLSLILFVAILENGECLIKSLASSYRVKRCSKRTRTWNTWQ
jgi:hypothetical protein